MSDIPARCIFRDHALDSEFDRSGYCILSHPELERLVDVANAVFEENADAYKAATFRSTFQIADLLHRLTVHASLTAVFDSFIQEATIDCRIIWAGFAVKQPSGTLCYLDLHQDVSMCYLATGRAPATAWIPLRDTNDKTGGMSVIPKQKFFDATPRAYGETKNWQDEATTSTLLAAAITLNVNLGQALFFHQALLHCSAGNFDSSVRVAVMLILLPREKRVMLYRTGESVGETVSDDFYVKHPMKVL